jgi:hypothetical protein
LDILDPAQLPEIDAEPLDRRDRRRRRQELRQHRPQQPGLAARESRSGPGLHAQRHEVGHALLRIGDAGRPAPRIAGMPLREPPARIPRARTRTRTRRGGEKIRTKRLILLDSSPEMQRIAGGSRVKAENFGHRQTLRRKGCTACKFMICSRQGLPGRIDKIFAEIRRPFAESTPCLL